MSPRARFSGWVTLVIAISTTWEATRSTSSKRWNSTIRTIPGTPHLTIGDIGCSTERQLDYAGIIFSRGKFK